MAQQHDVTKTAATPGTMNIGEQQRTFAGFVRLATWVTILSILVLIFLALANS